MDMILFVNAPVHCNYLWEKPVSLLPKFRIIPPMSNFFGVQIPLRLVLVSKGKAGQEAPLKEFC